MNRKRIIAAGPATLLIVLLAGCRADMSISVQPMSPLAAPAPTQGMAEAMAPVSERLENGTAPSGEDHAAATETDAPLTPSSATLAFSDRTEDAGVAFTHATPITSGDGAQMISGAAVGDFNRDGWLDIFVTSFGTLDDMAARRHRPFRNNGDLTFAYVAVAHISPDMQSFYEAYGLGGDGLSVAPLDVAAVALASTQALQTTVEAQNAQIAVLEAQVATLQASVERLEEMAHTHNYLSTVIK